MEFFIFLLLLILCCILLFSLKKDHPTPIFSHPIPMDPGMVNFLLLGYKKPHLGIAGSFLAFKEKTYGKTVEGIYHTPSRQNMLTPWLEDKNQDWNDEKRDAFLKEWFQSIEDDLVQGGYLYPGKKRAKNYAPVLLGALLSIGSFVLLAKPYYPGALPLILSMLYLYLWLKKAGSLPLKGQEALSHWQGKIQNHSFLEEERPFAIALGESEKDPIVEKFEDVFIGKVI